MPHKEESPHELALNPHVSRLPSSIRNLLRRPMRSIMTCAAVVAILPAFIGKVGGLLQTIPTPVMGGLLIILFGAIVVIGLNLLVKAGENLLEPRNLAIVALVLVTGVGGLSVGSAEWALKGIGLAGIIVVVANLLLPGRLKQS